MKIFLLIVFAFLILRTSITAQCLQQHSFTTQAQINAFPMQYPGCDSILSLIISGNDITDLSPLLGIRDVRFNVNISNNPLLPNLHGLDSLRHGGSGFQIENNLSLTSLEGLGSLTVIDEFLDISHNPRLKNLMGLENLSYLLSFLITENDSLESIDGLESIVEGVWVDIERNPMLQSLQGLHNFEWGDLTIGNNDALVNLDGLEKVHTLLWMEIYGNENLRSLTGLEKLSEVTNGVHIYENPNLTECAIYYFCQTFFDPDDISELFNNGPSCNTLDEILASCNLSNSYAIGHVYLDLNCNQIFDSGDVPLRQHILESVDSHRPIAATTQTGEFVKYLFDDDTLNIRPRELQGFTSVPTSYQIITDTAFQIFDSIDFALCPDTLFYDLEVSLTGYTLPRPGFNNSYQICIQNTGTFTVGANIAFDFSNVASSDYVTILNADAFGVINGTTVTWSIPNIPIFTRYCMDVEIVLDASTPLGTILYPHVSATPIESVTEIDLTNNEVAFEQRVVGSVDPNDKMVNTDRIDFTTSHHSLEYIIRFQNTGTSSATFIEVIDTLDAALDIRSFEMLQSSHSYLLSFPDSNVIQWHFDKIFLPDSTSNEQGSHGFVKFNINTFNGLEANRNIENKAAIYFDHNLPVITNVASTTIIGPCYDAFYFYRQSQIDSFPIVHPDCDSILSLIISGDNIIDLSPLSQLKSVNEGFAIINNPLLRDFEGLENIEYGGTWMQIEYNPNLVSTKGFESLRRVNGWLAIIGNPRITDLRGFENLSSVVNMEIFANDSLFSLDGLESIVSDLSLYIHENPMLQSVSGLQNLTRAGNLLLSNNDDLINLNGLNNFEVANELIVKENKNLETIKGFEKLNTINTSITIQDNPKLSACAIDFFCDSLFSPFLEYQILFNGPSCSSLDEILATCTISSLQEIDFLENISIFPNPSPGSFYLQFDAKENTRGKIELQNAGGSAFLSENFDAVAGNRYSKKIELRSYPSGIYFLSIVSKEGIVTRKVFLNRN
jgi:hypothetical protein